ncbi:hypothetical protein ACHAW5_006491 [Stephanodiscus triporus]|uniref:Peptidase C-terminal archaeal/bacterial domain-containing protein n=1 Tax=Stephanodiscus triporus TaxID=2934178 RepID=A0ABD3MN75_9STRA
MWQHVSSRGTCTNVPPTTTPRSILYTVPITDMALSGEQIRHYYMDVTTGQTVSCSTNGPNGDADLYMRFGDQAVPDSAFVGNACSSDSDTSMESCSTAAASAPTRVYAAVHAWSTFSGLTFQCTVSAVMYTVPINNMALSGGQIRHYYIEVTTGQTVSCSTNGPNGDADLYMRFGDQAIPDSAFVGNACSSDSDTSMESCSTAAAWAPTRVYAAVHAWSTFSGLTFQCTVSAVMYTVPINNMALSGEQIRHYYMDVTTGQTVSCSTNGPNGDADLYMRFGDQAVPDSAFVGNACSSDLGTSMESCSTAAASAPTRVYAAVHAWSTFSGLTFQCTVSAPTGSPTSARPYVQTHDKQAYDTQAHNSQAHDTQAYLMS